MMCPFLCVHKPFLKANGNFFAVLCFAVESFCSKKRKVYNFAMLSINKPFVRVLCVNFNGNVLFMKNVRNFRLFGYVRSHALLPDKSCLLSFEFKYVVRREKSSL